jgi:ATP-binding cassette subfamily F protein uup
MDQHNAWDFETQYKNLFIKLEDFKLKVKTFLRTENACQAIILINRPDLLILMNLQSPRLEMIEWLESYFF